MFAPRYQFNWHHHKIIRALELVAEGEIKRLIIEAPPRHGKSELVSRLFSAWLLGRDPDIRIIACSYSSDLAIRMNRDVQRNIDAPAYAALFPKTKLFGKNVVTMSQGSWLRNSEIFEIVDHRGTYRGAGVGGGITGMGGDCLIIDDPFKDRASANSPTIRQNIWDWYTSTFRTRLEPGGSVVIMHTRWSTDDLVGRLLDQQDRDPDADQWHRLYFPAIAEGQLHPWDPRSEGEALWDTRYPLPELLKIKASLGTYDWESLYQQRPTPLGGGMIRTDWWRYYSILPPGGRKVWAWDTAFKDKEQNDYSVGILLLESPDGYFVLDVQRHRVQYPELKRILVSCWQRDPGVALLIEDKASGQSLIQELQRTTTLPILPRKADSDKVTRLQSVLPLIESGRVFLPEGSPWLADFLAECSHFPSGSHDDQIDALVHGLQYLTENRDWRSLYGAFA